MKDETTYEMRERMAAESERAEVMKIDALCILNALSLTYAVYDLCTNPDASIWENGFEIIAGSLGAFIYSPIVRGDLDIRSAITMGVSAVSFASNLARLASGTSGHSVAMMTAQLAARAPTMAIGVSQMARICFFDKATAKDLAKTALSLSTEPPQSTVSSL